MNKGPCSSFLWAGLAVVVVSLACSLVAPAPTAAPPATVAPVSSNTPEPTASPEAPSTPDAAATKGYDDILAQVQKFADQGLISSTNGKYTAIDDFKKDFSQIGYYKPYLTNLVIGPFVFVGHLSWQTAAQTSDVSGCGIVFGHQEDTSDYAVFLDRSRVYFASSTATSYRELGKTRGSGRLNFGNPAEADLALLVSAKQAYVYVDDSLIGQYTLSQDKPLSGKFGYGIISGTNRDYGTRCAITNGRVWALNP